MKKFNLTAIIIVFFTINNFIFGGCASPHTATNPQSVIGGTTSTTTANVRACAGTIRDGGGTGNYGTCRDERITICPSTHGDVIRLTFSVLDVESEPSDARLCKDYLLAFQTSDPTWATSGDGTFTGGNYTDIFCGTLGTAALPLPVITSTAPDGCVSLQFISDNNATGGGNAGFAAAISCVTPCKNPTARIAGSATPIYVCPTGTLNPTSQPLSFDGSGSTKALSSNFDTDGDGVVDNDDFGTETTNENVTALTSSNYHSTTQAGISISTYDWNFGDGTTATGATSSTTHSFNTPGIYSVTLSVRDSNTDIDPLGCQSSNQAKQLVYVVPPPTRTENDITLKCDASNINNSSPAIAGLSTTGSLTATASTITEVETLPTIQTTPTLLPDGTGASYTNSVNYGGYFATGKLMDNTCYPTVSFSLEHSWAGDLFIDLISPDGKVVRLYNRVGGSLHFGTCSNGINNDAAGGCPSTYTVVPSGGVAWPTPTTGSLTWIFSTPLTTCANYTGTCEAAYYVRPNFNYAPSSPMSALDNAVMNGSWTLRVTDNQSLDNGKLFSWSITFPPSCFKVLEEISPLVSEIEWVTDGDVSSTTTNTAPAPGDPCPTGATCNGTSLSNSTTVGPYGASGTITYDYVVTDQHNCEWPGSSTITVVCPLPIELISFNAINQLDKVDLKWIVASERDNDYYTLLKSYDGLNFDYLGKVRSKVNGNSSQTVSYDFVDENPSSGLTYYQLKQTDFDGTIKTVGEIVNERSETFGGISLHPNPAQSNIILEFSSEYQSEIVLLITDMSGKKVDSKTLNVTKGHNIIDLDIESYSKGLFIIELQSNKEIFRSKFTKN